MKPPSPALRSIDCVSEPLDTDADLVRRCLAGEEAGYALLLERHQGRVYSFLLRLVGDAHHAEDLAQVVFLKAFRSLESFDLCRPFHSWLFAVAHHAALDFLRARKTDLSLDHDEYPIDPADAADGPERRAETALDGAIIERLIAALPPLYREALLLRHVSGLSVEDVAAALGIGLLIEMAIVPATVALAVSVIGIPFIPVAYAALAASFILGMGAFFLLMARRVCLNLGKPEPSTIKAVGLAGGATAAISIAGGLLPVIGGVLGLALFLTLCCGMTLGLGAVWITRFGTRPV